MSVSLEGKLMNSLTQHNNLSLLYIVIMSIDHVDKQMTVKVSTEFFLNGENSFEFSDVYVDILYW